MKNPKTPSAPAFTAGGSPFNFNMTIRRVAYGANSLSELSAIYCRVRDATGEGNSTFGSVDVFDKARKHLGHVSYNGRVWSGTAKEWNNTSALIFDNAAPVTSSPLNAVLAAQTVISAWTNWTDEAEAESDAILNAALSYAKAILTNAPHQIPDDMKKHFADAILVMGPDGRDAPALPNLTFSEAIEPLREFVKRSTGSRPLGEILGATENVGSVQSSAHAKPLGAPMREVFADAAATHRFPGSRR